MEKKFIIVYCTVPTNEIGLNLAKKAVEKRLAACCNLIPSVQSIFEWDGKVNIENEFLLMFKTIQTKFVNLQELIESEHPYDVPEIISVAIAEGNKDYLNWVDKNVK